MEYSKLSDFDIDEAVAKIKFPGLKVTNFAGEAVVWFGNLETRVVRYCNNAADAWPIILQSRLYIDPIYIKDWCVTSECDSYREIHANPLRAAMIVFLMMRESE
ncbi:phage protein NinX family protein [Erwinia rhapontici]|uniref:phage protein NinX family protein n=1 Tax=Erwinia rhapontici TaxID=55212 RepID=UPI00133191F1|nr:phage protein NinX family protein [Erwinia rhapontici]MBP2156892.1 hypothetical protein [Erwinia rhapontici]